VHHVIKTDNKSVANKVFLRRKATEHLDELRVLDLFAGNNVLWNCIDTQRYYGVELITDKGINLNANAKQIIDSLDLSEFNVIDCDSYGIPFEICGKILTNPAVKKETVVIYTAITNIFARLPKVCVDVLNINELYKITPSLFNSEAIVYFYDMLANLGVQTVHYYEVIDHYTKHYGYFIIT
jgi:hypothetical protein